MSIADILLNITRLGFASTATAIGVMGGIECFIGGAEVVSGYLIECYLSRKFLVPAFYNDIIKGGSIILGTGIVSLLASNYTLKYTGSMMKNLKQLKYNF